VPSANPASLDQVGVHPPRPLAVALLVSLRPKQWTKNFIVFAGLIFGGKLTDPSAATAALGAFLAFCLLSSVVYLVNDFRDREADKRHPVSPPPMPGISARWLP
jgi:4-hydroxybenzoate polyprenyltransferase